MFAWMDKCVCVGVNVRARVRREREWVSNSHIQMQNQPLLANPPTKTYYWSILHPCYLPAPNCPAMPRKSKPLTVVYPYPTVTIVPATVDLGEKRGKERNHEEWVEKKCSVKESYSLSSLFNNRFGTTLTCSEVDHQTALYLQQIGTDVVATDECQDSPHDCGDGAGHQVVNTPQGC